MHFVALAMGLCVAMIAFVRLPSLKVSCLLLSGLLIYDVFWVSVWFGFAKTLFMLWICSGPWASFTWFHGMKLRESGKARRWAPPLHSEMLNSTTGYRIVSLLITWNKAEIRLEYFDFCIFLKGIWSSNFESWLKMRTSISHTHRAVSTLAQSTHGGFWLAVKSAEQECKWTYRTTRQVGIKS